MSDSAFKSAPFPGYTTDQLKGFITVAKTDGFYEGDRIYQDMQAEIDRRAKVQKGDKSVMTDGERLRFSRTEEDQARAFAMRLVPVDYALARWAQEKAVAGFSVGQIKDLISKAMAEK